MNDVMRLIREIHQRSVWQVLTVYLAISWVALQVVETVVDSANLPEWLPGFALVLLVIGFPVVVATAFVQEGAPGTVGGRTEVEDGDRAKEDGAAPERRAPEAPRHVPSRAHTVLTWRNAFMGGVGALALWGMVAAALVTTGRPIGPRGLGAEERPSLAVLPLQALSLG